MKVSLIIPVKSEESRIRDLLDSLLKQTRKVDEIVIVDGGSVDRTVEIIKTYREKGLPINLIISEGALPGKGRNIAIENSQFDIIAMTDGGIILDKRWLENLISSLEKDSSIDVVYGVYGCYAKTLFEKSFCIVYMPPSKQFVDAMISFPSLASIIIKKYVWEKIGGFREDLRSTEDLIFIEEIEKRKFKIKLAMDAIVYWRPRKNLKETFILSLKYAICNALINFHILRYIKKYIMYIVGFFLVCLGTKYMFWIILLLIGFLINLFLVCGKHRKQFLELISSKPQALFYIMFIILALDISQLIGFSIGKIKKYVRSSTTK